MNQEYQNRSPWLWIPSLYFAEGLPYVLTMTVSVIMYKKMGISNAEIALYTSWLYLPWVIKPLWSPVVDLFRTKRFWIVLMQLLIGGGLACLALTIPVSSFFKTTLIFFWLLAFSSATHDIAADGFYMLGLTQHHQAWFVGVRSTFYRLAMVTGQGLLVILAGYIEMHSGLPSVQLKVESLYSAAKEIQILANSLDTTEKPGELRIIMDPGKLTIAIHPLSGEKLAGIVKNASEINSIHLKKNEKVSEQEKPHKKSWWQNVIALPLEKLIKRKFSREKAISSENKAGNIGIVYYRLSKPPGNGKKVTVNFGRESGDKSISLLTGSQGIFDNSSWNRPVAAVIQLDAKLKSASCATFIATAGNIRLSWIVSFVSMAALFAFFAIYHRAILPHAVADANRARPQITVFFKQFRETFILFFKRDKIAVILLFLLFYRFAEAQLVKLAAPFLLDRQEIGGLALTTGQVGFVYGTVGLLALTIGGLLGGFVVAKHGLRKWIWWMAIAIQLPDAVYVYLSYQQPDDFLIINLCVAIEQFGYGFGFTAYMLYMIYIAEGQYKTAHFAIATGFMALGMMLPGMMSGWIQEMIGYQNFFVWVMIATIPGFAILKFLPLDREFGRK